MAVHLSVNGRFGNACAQHATVIPAVYPPAITPSFRRKDDCFYMDDCKNN